MKRQHFTIYRHTNRVNGKRYVGQTVGSVTSRWREHLSAARAGRGSPVLGAAIHKYGADAFEHEVLDVVTTQAGADIAETVWIKQSNSRVPSGYNLFSGGGSNGHHHEDTKRRIADTSRARWLAMTPEQRSTHIRKMCVWTPQRKVDARLLIQSKGMRIKISSGQKSFWSKLTTEEKSARVKHQLAGLSTEQKSERVRKAWADTTPEARAERVRKSHEGNLKSSGPERSKKLREFQTARQASLTPEQKRASGLKTHATRLERYGPKLTNKPKTHEEYSESTKRGWANMTPEARAERIQKGLEGRRVAKANMTPEELAERTSNRSRGVKEGKRKAKEALLIVAASIRQPRILRLNLLPRIRSGGRPANPNMTPATLECARAMRAAGASLSQITKRLCVPTTTLCRALKSGKTRTSARGPNLVLFNLMTPRIKS